MKWKTRLFLVAFSAFMVIPARIFAQQKLIDVVFTRAVVDREPVSPFEPGAYCETKPEPSEPIPILESKTESQVIFWNRIESSEEGAISHTWYENGVKVSEVELKVGVSNRWRTWSTKKILPGLHAGKWKVVVSTVGTTEEVLCTAHFIVK